MIDRNVGNPGVCRHGQLGSQCGYCDAEIERLRAELANERRTSTELAAAEIAQCREVERLRTELAQARLDLEYWKAKAAVANTTEQK